ncbi:MAG: glycosyltransferase family 2 protein [Candidatus Cohnella colombiensis]|uniref:Glycosyltransferase family 2 protein n=1 Tax=Candidatus Cohnella colombiensis TaxID=3121368 RepID=A0AA95EXP0_9BACL|nr:MAG: glycosyltransferase family 2 protein [Cohnella sp.]
MSTLISLCMIVKDEEASLGRCLDSVKQYVDEIIIVDTGSTDRTIDIAKRYTDRIYHFKWINDFAAARNESLKHATSTWIVILDADDYMEQKDIAQLREKLSSISPRPNIAYQIPYISIIGKQQNSSINKSSAIRIFPNHMGIYFHRPIHEQVMSDRGLTMKAVALNIPIYHTGYLDNHVESKRKHERNMKIFNEMKQHMTLTSYDYYTIGNEHLVAEAYEDGLDAYEQALLLSHTDDPWVTPLRVCMLDTLLLLKRFADAWIFIDKYLEDLKQYADIRCLIGITLHGLGFKERSKLEFLEAIQLADARTSNKEDAFIINADYAYVVPIRYLIQQYECEGNFSQCIYYLTKLLVSNPTDLSALTKMIQLLSLQEVPSAIIRFFEQLAPNDNKEHYDLLLAKISLFLGSRELTHSYVNRTSVLEQLEFHELLRNAMLFNDEEQYNQLVQSATPNQLVHPLTIKELRLGSAIWATADYPEWSTDIASEVLYELYTLQQYECFDQLVQQFSSSADIVNRIADYLYRNHHHEIALQYHSHLLDHNQLNAENSIHVAQMYINQNQLSEALPFIDYALKLKPESKELYIMYYVTCNDPHMKQQILTALIDLDPTFRQLTALLEAL